MKATAAVALVALLLGGGLGWSFKPAPAPRVEVRVREMTQEERASLVHTVTVAGPVERVAGPTRVVERWRILKAPAPPPTPGCPPCPECEEHERIEESGPVTEKSGPVRTEQSVASTASVSTQKESEAKSTPAPPLARWNAGAGLLLGTDLKPHPTLNGGVRLVGPFWVDAWIAPTRLEAGAGLRASW